MGMSADNEAELQARLESAVKKSFPNLTGFRLERYLTVQLGHTALKLDGLTHHQPSASGRYDCVLFVSEEPVILFELKKPGYSITNDDFKQALSYAKIHLPLIPLTAISNGDQTLVRTTYEEVELSGSIDKENLNRILQSTLRSARSGVDHAIHQLLCTDREIWKCVVAEHNKLTFNHITGLAHDLKKAVVREMQIERQCSHEAVTCLLENSKPIVAIHGGALSGVSNALVQIAADVRVCGLYFSSPHEDVLAAIANGLSRQTNSTITRSDIISWLNKRNDSFLITVIVDGAIPAGHLEELLGYAERGALRVVIGVNEHVYSQMITRGGSRYSPRFVALHADYEVAPFNETELSHATTILKSNWNARFSAGYEFIQELRLPTTMRLIAASLSASRVDTNGFKTPEDSMTMLLPIPDMDYIADSAKVYAGNPEVVANMSIIADKFISDLMSPGFAEMSIRCAHRLTISMEDNSVSSAVHWLSENGHVSQGLSTSGDARNFIRTEPIFLYFVAKKIAQQIVKFIKSSSDLTAYIDGLATASTLIYGGDRTIALALRMACWGDHPIHEAGSKIVRHLINLRPITMPMPEGSHGEVLTKDGNLEIKMENGRMLARSTGDWHDISSAKEMSGLTENYQSWMILSYLVSHNDLAQSGDFDLNMYILQEIGRYERTLYNPQITKMSEIRPVHTHDLGEGISIPCTTNGLVEPFMQSMFVYLGKKPEKISIIAEYACNERSLPLLYRLSSVLSQLQTLSDYTVSEPALACKERIDDLIGEIRAQKIRKTSTKYKSQVNKKDRLERQYKRARKRMRMMKKVSKRRNRQ